MVETKNQILEALLSGDHNRSSTLVKNLIDTGTGIEEIYEAYLKPSLYEIGELWEQNKISVATEHLASAIVESLLNEIYLKFSPTQPLGKTVVVTCLENESHQIGARMVADIFEMHGWKVLFLGANTPKKDLVNYLKMTKPDMVAISVSIYFHLPTLEETLDLIRENFQDLMIIMGGQAFLRGGIDLVNKYEKVSYLSGFDSIKRLILA